MNIPSTKIYFPEDDRRAIARELDNILASGNLTLGRKGEEFERAFAGFNNAEFAVAVSSGASALEIILRCVDVQDAEVIVPVNTSADTPLAVMHAGGKIKFVDCDETFCVDVQQVKKLITKKTKAVILVHIGGWIHPRIGELQNICQKNNIALIEDAAHAHGSSLYGKKAGSFGIAASFSFYPTKVMTSGEGGMILTLGRALAEEAKRLRDRGKPEFHSSISIENGSSWRMSEVHALLGIFQLRRLKKFVESRREIAAFYDKELKKTEKIKPLLQNSQSNYYKYIALLDDDVKRVWFKDEMKKRGVSLGGEVYAVPCHLQPVFQEIGYKKGDFPAAEYLSEHHVCLPLFPVMKAEEYRYVIETLKEVLENN